MSFAYNMDNHHHHQYAASPRSQGANASSASDYQMSRGSAMPGAGNLMHTPLFGLSYQVTLDHNYVAARPPTPEPPNNRHMGRASERPTTPTQNGQLDDMDVAEEEVLTTHALAEKMHMIRDKAPAAGLPREKITKKKQQQQKADPLTPSKRKMAVPREKKLKKNFDGVSKNNNNKVSKEGPKRAKKDPKPVAHPPPMPVRPPTPPSPRNAAAAAAAAPPNDSETETDEDYANSVTRCICGFVHDDGFMVCCDKCDVWQHCECMGLKRNALGKNYFCERCAPRPIDPEAARLLQIRKRESSLATSSESDSDDKLEISLDKPRRGSVSGKGPATKGKSEGKKRRRRRRAKREESSPWNCFLKPWTNSYEEAGENKLSPRVNALLESNSIPEQADESCTTPEFGSKPYQTAFVLQNRKGLEATENIMPHCHIGEYRGKVVLREEFNFGGFCRELHPFVMFFSVGETSLVVDASSYGVDTRFVRRSCCPNAEVRHVVEDGEITFHICSTMTITEGLEITIPFDYDYQKCKFHVECGCSRATCDIMKRKTTEPKPAPVKRRSKSFSGPENIATPKSPTRPVAPQVEAVKSSAKKTKASPLKIKIEGNREPPSTPLAPTSGGKKTPAKQTPAKQQNASTPEPSPPVTQAEESPEPLESPNANPDMKHLSREERKLAMMIKAIEDATKRQQKKEVQTPKETPKSKGRHAGSTSTPLGKGKKKGRNRSASDATKPKAKPASRTKHRAKTMLEPRSVGKVRTPGNSAGASPREDIEHPLDVKEEDSEHKAPPSLEATPVKMEPEEETAEDVLKTDETGKDIKMDEGDADKMDETSEFKADEDSEDAVKTGDASEDAVKTEENEKPIVSVSESPVKSEIPELTPSEPIAESSPIKTEPVEEESRPEASDKGGSLDTSASAREESTEEPKAAKSTSSSEDEAQAVPAENDSSPAKEDLDSNTDGVSTPRKSSLGITISSPKAALTPQKLSSDPQSPCKPTVSPNKPTTVREIASPGKMVCDPTEFVSSSTTAVTGPSAEEEETPAGEEEKGAEEKTSEAASKSENDANPSESDAEAVSSTQQASDVPSKESDDKPKPPPASQGSKGVKAEADSSTDVQPVEDGEEPKVRYTLRSGAAVGHKESKKPPKPKRKRVKSGNSANATKRRRFNSGASNSPSNASVEDLSSRGDLSASESSTSVGHDEFKFHKTKKQLHREWAAGKAEESKTPLTVKVDEEEEDLISEFIISHPSPSLQKPGLPFRSTSLTEPVVGSAKKRWLRQATLDDSSNQNGADSGPQSPVPMDYVTPLKKRLLRGSVDTPQRSGPGFDVTSSVLNVDASATSQPVESLSTTEATPHMNTSDKDREEAVMSLMALSSSGSSDVLSASINAAKHQESPLVSPVFENPSQGLGSNSALGGNVAGPTSSVPGLAINTAAPFVHGPSGLLTHGPTSPGTPMMHGPSGLSSPIMLSSGILRHRASVDYSSLLTPSTPGSLPSPTPKVEPKRKISVTEYRKRLLEKKAHVTSPVSEGRKGPHTPPPTPVATPQVTTAVSSPSAVNTPVPLPIFKRKLEDASENESKRSRTEVKQPLLPTPSKPGLLPTPVKQPLLSTPVKQPLLPTPTVTANVASNGFGEDHTEKREESPPPPPPPAPDPVHQAEIPARATQNEEVVNGSRSPSPPPPPPPAHPPQMEASLGGALAKPRGAGDAPNKPLVTELVDKLKDCIVQLQAQAQTSKAGSAEPKSIDVPSAVTNGPRSNSRRNSTSAVLSPNPGLLSSPQSSQALASSPQPLPPPKPVTPQTRPVIPPQPVPPPKSATPQAVPPPQPVPPPPSSNHTRSSQNSYYSRAATHNTAPKLQVKTKCPLSAFLKGNHAFMKINSKANAAALASQKQKKQQEKSVESRTNL